MNSQPEAVRIMAHCVRCWKPTTPGPHCDACLAAFKKMGLDLERKKRAQEAALEMLELLRKMAGEASCTHGVFWGTITAADALITKIEGGTPDA